MMRAGELPSPVDAASLLRAVRRALLRPVVLLEGYRVRPLNYAAVNPVSGGVYRVEGVARDETSTVQWSLILKIVFAPRPVEPAQRSGDSAPYHDPARLEYWRREVLVYQSGILEGSSRGMRAARCYDIAEYADDIAAIWLEDLSDGRRESWCAADYRRVALDLGRFSAQQAERPPPPHPWFSRGCVRALANARGALAAELIERRATWRHPLARRYFSGSVADRLLGVWRERHTYLDALDRLPRTLCHFDISRHNILLPEQPSGAHETVAIDWASAGIGAVGEDLSLLIPSPFFRLEEDVERLSERAERIYDGYLRGLEEAGWRGVERQVRLAYTISVALRTVFIAPTLLAISDERAKAYEEQRWGASLEEIVAQRAPLTTWLLARAEEARDLLRAV